MANDYKYYGGSNQIAKLPYKTIDALQQLGLYVGRNEEEFYVQLNSDLQDNDPDYSCELNAFNKISCDTLDTSTINAYDIRIDGKSIYRDFFRIIKISKNLALTNSFTNEEVSKIVGLDQSGDKTCLLYDGSDNIVLVRDITILRNQILSMKGVIITDGDDLNTTNIKQWSVQNGAWKTPIPFETTKQYVHMMKIVSTAGDTCYLTAVSPLSKRAKTSYITVKLYIIGDTTTAEGTSISTMTGEYACTGYNSTTNKTIVALDLGENKFVYSDGTKSTEALSSSNTTVTGDVYGQPSE